MEANCFWVNKKYWGGQRRAGPPFDPFGKTEPSQHHVENSILGSLPQPIPFCAAAFLSPGDAQAKRIAL